MSIRYLDWDSRFFKRKIGILEYMDESTTDLLESLQKAKKDNYELIYLFMEPDMKLDHELTTQFHYQHVDRKVLFEKSLERNANSFSCNKFSSELDSIIELYALGLESGEYSRFNIDKRFSNADFESLYKTWIDRSLSGEFADDVFVNRTNGILGGFITVSYKETIAKIGLIAVNKILRGRGVGKSLINCTVHASIDKGCTRLQVATQFDNINAYKFYLSNNMHLKEVKDTYHIWL